MRARLAALALCALSALAPFTSACGDPAPKPQAVDSNTNWLKSCERDSECEGASACLCGLCTVDCESDAQCAIVDEDARCESVDGPSAMQRCESRGAHGVLSICAIACGAGNACGETLVCGEGLCERAAEAALDGSIDGATDAVSGGDGDGDGDGDAGGDGDAASDADTDAASAACAPGPCDHGRCSDDGMSCECAIGVSGAQCETVANVRQLVAGVDFSCALLAPSRVKCWGGNAFGQLGQGDTAARGDAPGELGAMLDDVDLGTTTFVRALAAGGSHVCALLEDGSVRCWGGNANGQLGIGDIEPRGDEANEMGAALQPVELSEPALQISAGNLHSCALLSEGRAVCWGGNVTAQLGLGDTNPRGDQAGELGDALDPIDLGDVSAGIAELISTGPYVCARLADGVLKCWGFGGVGQLGVGDTLSRGDQAGEMGTMLPSADLGGAVQRIATGANHNCALLDSGAVKCWGQNGSGQLGLGDTNARADSSDEIGAMLPTLMRPAGTVTALAAGALHGCLALDDSDVLCWGQNDAGQLGRGSLDNFGDDAIESALALPGVDL